MRVLVQRALAAAVVITSSASVTTACGTFLEAAPSDDAGVEAGVGRTDGATPEAGEADDGGPKPTVGCASLVPYLFCADFDQAATLGGQISQPGGKPLEVQGSGDGTLTVITMNPYSPPNAMNVTGNGVSASFKQVFGRSAITLSKTRVRLKMRVRASKLPGPNDAFIATLDFANYRVSAALHASGTFAVAQSAPADETPVKTESGAFKVQSETWSQLEIDLDFGASNSVVVKLNGEGTPATLPVKPTGPVTVGVGVGYCDANNCGKPSIDFDDVVLVEE